MARFAQIDSQIRANRIAGLRRCARFARTLFRKIRAPIKIKSALPPPPPRNPKYPPPLKGGILWTWVFPADSERTHFFEAPIKLAHPFPASELRTRILRTREFFWVMKIAFFCESIRANRFWDSQMAQRFATPTQGLTNSKGKLPLNLGLEKGVFWKRGLSKQSLS